MHEPDPDTIRLHDGRTLAYRIYGRRDGRPVHFFHGFPSSRLLAAFLHDKALAAGVCLVASDRPGFGGSTFAPGRTVLDWPADAMALADHLSHDRFDLIGVSCGGPYALAVAHARPQRIGRVALMAGMGPMDLPQIRRGQMKALTLMFALARVQPWLISPMLAMDRLLYRGDRQRALKTVASMLSGPDRALLASRPQVADGFVASMAEAYRQGIRAALHEARLIGSARGFDLSSIRVPVHVYQGDLDRHVPPEMGFWLAQQIPGARLHACDGEGHLSILWNRFDEALAVLAA